MQLDPLSLGKVGPPGNVGPSSESYCLMIVFFEKAMITGLPLQNKLRTYKKKKEKNNVRAFFQLVGLGPPPHRLSRRKCPGRHIQPIGV